MNNKKITTILFQISIALSSFFFQACEEDVYIESPVVPEQPSTEIDKIENWQDKKFGMIIHFGIYSFWGEVESWNLCAELWNPFDSAAYVKYKKRYWSAIDSFAPMKFDADQWAEIADKAGMKYVVFTTKHHDGFSMYDTKFSDYSITKGAFKDSPQKDITKEVFSAFRKKDFLIGAYYSKPDRHSQDFWWDTFPTPDRFINYDILEFPERFDRYKQFVANQLDEITGGQYGKIDILWLDGGAMKGLPLGMPEIVEKAKNANPNIIVVNRDCEEFVDYVTPEQTIPDDYLPFAWESCITLSDNWGYVPWAKYKSAAKVVRTLVEIVAKGGNLLLGIGPAPDGTIPEEAVSILSEIGDFLAENGDAIYNTIPLPPYNEGNVFYTQSKDGKTKYTITFETDDSMPSVSATEL